MAKHEIFNNGNLMLSSDDECSIPVIWNNITGLNSTSRSDHYHYLRFIKYQGFIDGEIELVKDGIKIKKAEIKLPECT